MVVAPCAIPVPSLPSPPPFYHPLPHTPVKHQPACTASGLQLAITGNGWPEQTIFQALVSNALLQCVLLHVCSSVHTCPAGKSWCRKHMNKSFNKINILTKWLS